MASAVAGVDRLMIASDRLSPPPLARWRACRSAVRRPGGPSCRQPGWPVRHRRNSPRRPSTEQTYHRRQFSLLRRATPGDLPGRRIRQHIAIWVSQRLLRFDSDQMLDNTGDPLSPAVVLIAKMMTGCHHNGPKSPLAVTLTAIAMRIFSFMSCYDRWCASCITVATQHLLQAFHRHRETGQRLVLAVCTTCSAASAASVTPMPSATTASAAALPRACGKLPRGPAAPCDPLMLRSAASIVMDILPPCGRQDYHEKNRGQVVSLRQVP